MGIWESLKCLEQVFTPGRIFARWDPLWAQQDLKRVFKVFVVGLERIVDIKCFDPIPVNLFLVNIFNSIFIYFLLLIVFLFFFLVLLLFFLFRLIFCIYSFFLLCIFFVVFFYDLLWISIIFLRYALGKLDLWSQLGNLLGWISFDLLMEDFFIFVRNDAVLFQNALSNLLNIFSNWSFALSEHKITLELWLVLSSFNNLLDFLTVRHTLDDFINRFFFTFTNATCICDIFGIKTHQLFII